MKDKIKACAFDIDGTLLDHSNYEIPASTIKAIKKLHELGYKIYIATSRVMGEIANFQKYYDTLPIDGFISAGGGMIHKNKKLINADYINNEDTLKIIEYCDKNDICVRYQSDNDCFIDRYANQSSLDSFNYFYQFIPNIVKWNKHDHVVNMLIFNNSEHRDNIKAMNLNVDMVFFSDAFEITTKHISKASALKYLASLDNIEMSEIVSFGDGENDACMLSMAGIGVAMGNGCIKAKESANFITKSIKENGIEYACMELGLID